ncbi:PREDICTED: LOB domain-containing protein 22-like [Lupinus angustifolius]|uniref:LOB domain-containing protein 22-like n=1 Tax=Lupinus angustifolius TaxID=3871 RepID=UPI00092ED1F7|nr:PREDICTED: LOB domain-containing protein 22-like [Lupinus angustifolius]
MKVKVGSNKACAACKYQRRKCSKNCPLASYFPADESKTFINAHRLFGVCNMTRILNQVKPDEKDETMKSIIFESDIRAKYPVQGCYGVTMHYLNSIYKVMEELSNVQMLLTYFTKQSKVKQHIPIVPVDQSSISPIRNYEIPIDNHDEDVSLFDRSFGNVYGDDDYMEKNDLYMEKSSCGSDITNVKTDFLDAKCNYEASYHNDHNQLDNISIENNMDAKSSKFNLMAKAELSYYDDAIPFSKYYNDAIPFNEFPENTGLVVEYKDACQSLTHCPD